jgi:DNA-binding MarR family transcriptional regulator
MKHSSLAAVEVPSFAGEAHALRDKLTQVLSIIDRESTTGRSPVAVCALDAQSTLVRVRAIIKARRQRNRLFADGLFSDPAWDLLLELYAAQLCGYRLAVSGLCLAVAAPATTALRWIGCLEERGLARRRPDPHDGRRVFISLSDAGLEAMNGLMREVPAATSLM